MRIETTRQRPSASRPPATAWSGLDTSGSGSFLAQPDYSTSGGFAGRVAATASASELVGAYRDHPATAPRGPTPSDSLEWSRYTSPRWRSWRHSTSGFLRWSSSGDELARSLRIETTPQQLRAGRPSASAWSGLDLRLLLRRGVDYSTSESSRWVRGQRALSWWARSSETRATRWVPSDSCASSSISPVSCTWLRRSPRS